MNAPSVRNDTAENWRRWAVLTYRDPAPVIEQRRRAAQRDVAYQRAQARWRAIDERTA